MLQECKAWDKRIGDAVACLFAMPLLFLPPPPATYRCSPAGQAAQYSGVPYLRGVGLRPITPCAVSPFAYMLFSPVSVGLSVCSTRYQLARFVSTEPNFYTTRAQRLAEPAEVIFAQHNYSATRNKRHY